MRRLTILISLLFCLTVNVAAQSARAHEKAELEKEMYQRFTEDNLKKFIDVTDRLKAVCKETKDEMLFYKAWANQVIYYAMKQEDEIAVSEAKMMKRYALEEDSEYGAYTAIHVMAGIYYRMNNYTDAERMYLESIDYLHKHFPEESAAPAYLELAKIAEKRGNVEKMEHYAEHVLKEKNCQPPHRLRALSYLCEIMEDKDDVEAFDKYYAMRKEVLKLTPPSRLATMVELGRLILHKEYKSALEMAKKLESPDQEEKTAKIYHLLGKDSLAYRLMLRSKQINDSLNRSLSADLIDDYIEQISKERKENANYMEQNVKLADRVEITLWVLLLVITLGMGYTIYRRRHVIRHLKEHNRQLQASKDAEHKALVAEKEAKEREHQALQKEHEARIAEHEALQKEHSALQREHEARQEAERALRVKRGFLNNISHEMRTPLNAISGFTQLLTTPGLELDEETKNDLNARITENTNLLTNIVDQMITLSFYNSQTVLEQEDDVCCEALAQEMAQIYSRKAVPGVVVNTDVKVDPELSIISNREALHKALQALLDNAVTYTMTGSITIGVEKVDDKLRLSVTDTGSGIPEAKRQDLFELFSETGKNVKTTGMGLSICKSIARLLNGAIALDTSYTGGTRFVLDVPFRQPQ